MRSSERAALHALKSSVGAVSQEDVFCVYFVRAAGPMTKSTKVLADLRGTIMGPEKAHITEGEFYDAHHGVAGHQDRNRGSRKWMQPANAVKYEKSALTEWYVQEATFKLHPNHDISWPNRRCIHKAGHSPKSSQSW
jgi:hypothetical protein